MNVKTCISTVRSIFLLCFVFYGLVLSKSLELIAVTSPQQWHQELLTMARDKYEGYLALTLAAASSGKSFFQQPEPLTEDCVRTGRVAMTLLTKPSTMLKTREFLAKCFRQTNMTSSQNPAEIVCKNVNAAVKQSNSCFPDFEELKMKVEFLQPTKNYITATPQQTAEEFFAKPLDVDKDPEVIKLEIMVNFFNFEYWITSQIVLKLSENDTIRSTVDNVFVEARDDYLEDLLAKSANKNETLWDANRPKKHENFAKMVEEYFLQNPLLKDEHKKLADEYEKLRKAHEKLQEEYDKLQSK